MKSGLDINNMNTCIHFYLVNMNTDAETNWMLKFVLIFVLMDVAMIGY